MADTGGVDDAIDGVRLGFANTVRRGSIAVVGASGTGMQEVTTIIHRAGRGIAQALGCGGRDLSDRVGARTMVSALGLLGVRAGRRQHQ